MTTWLEPRNSNSLNVMRLVLASLVLFSHSWPLGLGREAERNEPFSWLTGGQSTGGGIAVTAFFAISGFLIAMSWESSKGWLDYLRKRILRIHPGYFVAFVLMFWLIGPLTTNDPRYWDSVGVLGTIKEALLLRPRQPSGAFWDNPYPLITNGSLWTIEYEFWCYLFIALLGLTRILTSRVIVLSLLVACAAWLAIYPRGLSPNHADFWHFIPVPTNGEWPRLLTAFLSGTTLYLWRDHVPRSPWLFWGSVLALALSVPLSQFHLAASVCMTYPIFYLCYSASWFTDKCKRTDISYGVYLYAFPIQQLVVSFWGPSNPWILFLISLPLTICAGLLSFFLVEKPFMRLRPSKDRRPPGSEDQGTVANPATVASDA